MRISDWSSDVCSSDLFLREQLLHEFRMRAGEENLRPAIFAANIQDDRTDAIADAHYFARDLLIAADNTLGAAQIDDDMTELDALHDAGDDLSDAVLEFLILPLTLGVADLLENDLLRSEEHTSELQSLMRISYAVFCLKKKNINKILIDDRHA